MSVVGSLAKAQTAMVPMGTFGRPMGAASALWSRKASGDSRPQSESGRRPSMKNVAGLVHDVPNLTSLKRGSGGRSSFSGQVATVFGGSGRLGKCVANRLGKTGSQMIFPYRGDADKMRYLKPAGDLGQVVFTPFDLRDEASIKKAMMYSDTVINVTGREWETRNFKFEDINIKGPRLLAKCARECGVRNFIHISHLNAREKPQKIFTNGSNFLRTKWIGEKAVFDEFPEAIIFRPSDLYGWHDYFLNHIFDFWRRPITSNVVPLWKKGEYSIKAPLWCPDMAAGIVAALETPAARGRIIEAYGPGRFILSELVDWMHEHTLRTSPDWGYKRTDLRFSPLVWIQLAVLGNIPLNMGHKWFACPTIDKLERFHLTDEVEGHPNLEFLGVKPGRVQERMLPELDHFEVFKENNIKDRPTIHPLHEVTLSDERQIRMEVEESFF